MQVKRQLVLTGVQAAEEVVKFNRAEQLGLMPSQIIVITSNLLLLTCRQTHAQEPDAL